MPMRTIGMLLGIPEADQEAIRDRIDEGLRLTEGGMPDFDKAFGDGLSAAEGFAEYIDWRASHPSDDLMTELLQAEFEDEDGTVRRLTREEVLGYVNLHRRRRQRDHGPPHRVDGQGAGRASRPAPQLAEDRSLVPNAIEELLRYESPSPVQARYVTKDVEHHGVSVPAGSAVLLLTASGNRDERHFPDADRFDIHRTIDHHLAFGYGIHFCLGSALARLEGRIALDEVLQRFPTWEVDWDNAVQTRTSTVRGLGQAAGRHPLSRSSLGPSEPVAGKRGRPHHENSRRRCLERSRPVAGHRTRTAGGERRPPGPAPGPPGRGGRGGRPGLAGHRLRRHRRCSRARRPSRRRPRAWAGSTPSSMPPGSGPSGDWSTSAVRPGATPSTPTWWVRR